MSDVFKNIKNEVCWKLIIEIGHSKYCNCKVQLIVTMPVVNLHNKGTSLSIFKTLLMRLKLDAKEINTLMSYKKL